ncbi:MAG: XRE family transcriptional regulator [Acidobacteria bacterium]|nr:XRE family transcriptional regulator [Acidobacteriota bacterium]
MIVREVVVSFREIHEYSGMSQAQAAQIFGVTQPCVSDLMRGKINLFGRAPAPPHGRSARAWAGGGRDGAVPARWPGCAGCTAAAPSSGTTRAAEPGASAGCGH